MGAFLSSEDVAKNDEVESTYLKQAEAVQDYVRKTPFEENNSTMRRELTAYSDKGISDLRGGYNNNMQNMYDDYNGKLTTLRGGYDKSMQDMINAYNSQFDTLQTTLTNNYTAADDTLRGDYTNQFTTLRGDYKGNLSDLQTGLQGQFQTDLSALRGGYTKSMKDMEDAYNGELTALGTALRNEYTTGNSTLKNDYEGQFTGLRGGYNKNLSELSSDLQTQFQNNLSALRGDYRNGSLSDLRSESNSQYATLNNLFTEFRDTTYPSDKAAILKRADEIEALINAESSGIKTKFDTDLAAFKADYNQRLGDYVTTKRYDAIEQAVTAGLSPTEISRIKTIINSKNFTSLYEDLKSRGVITDVSPTQFLRHLRRKNYVMY